MSASAKAASRPPTTQDKISLLSASNAVQVQISPAPSGPALGGGTFLALAWTKLQISSHCTRWLFTPRTARSWNSAHAAPASCNSLSIVLKLTSTTRLIDRIDEPSHSMDRICERLCVGSLFMCEQ